MKFWNKSAESADIFIYGDITSTRWDETETTAKSFVEDLKSLNGADVTIHINSGGGDCFAATAIYNTLKNYAGKVTVSIEGLCASAATIIACGGDTITIAENSLLMIHDPTAGLWGFFDLKELGKVTTALNAIKSSIIQTYKTRTGKDDGELSELMSAETWYTAAEAVENKFADETAGEISAQFDDKKRLLFVNKLSVDCRKYNCDSLKSKIDGTPKNFVDSLLPTAEQIKAAENARIKNLNALKSGNAQADAIIDVAISAGQTAADISQYVDAVKKVKPFNPFAAVIEDNLDSGAENLSGSAEEKVDERKARAMLIAKFAK